ncbi:hypothetical protein GOP47_0021061, partial [Adiantum capillus-veneris]
MPLKNTSLSFGDAQTRARNGQDILISPMGMHTNRAFSQMEEIADIFQKTDLSPIQRFLVGLDPSDVNSDLFYKNLVGSSPEVFKVNLVSAVALCVDKCWRLICSPSIGWQAEGDRQSLTRRDWVTTAHLLSKILHVDVRLALEHQVLSGGLLHSASMLINCATRKLALFASLVADMPTTQLNQLSESQFDKQCKLQVLKGMPKLEADVFIGQVLASAMK